MKKIWTKSDTQLFDLEKKIENGLIEAITNHSTSFQVGAGMLYKWTGEIAKIKFANKPIGEVVEAVMNYNNNTPTGHLMDDGKWRRFTKKEITEITNSTIGGYKFRSIEPDASLKRRFKQKYQFR